MIRFASFNDYRRAFRRYLVNLHDNYVFDSVEYRWWADRELNMRDGSIHDYCDLAESCGFVPFHDNFIEG